MKTAAHLDDLAHRGWPALETRAVGNWVVRWGAGVTKRANSVLPRGEVDDLDDAIDAVEADYRGRGLPPTFQLSAASRPAGLAGRLAARGYVEDSHTLVQVADPRRIAASAPPASLSAASPDVAARALALSVADEPDDDWMGLWWSVDGRGDHADDLREAARRILTGAPARYAAFRDASGVVATARLAYVDGWAGLYAVATRPDARGRGLARRLVLALAREAAERGVERMWLQVLAGNAIAIGLYRSLGFETVSGYSYWTAPVIHG